MRVLVVVLVRAPVPAHTHVIITIIITTLILALVLVHLGVLRRATTATDLATLHVIALNVQSATGAISLATLLVIARPLRPLLMRLHPLLICPNPGAGHLQRAVQDPVQDPVQDQDPVHLVALDPAPGVVLVLAHLTDLQAQKRVILHHLLLQ